MTIRKVEIGRNAGRWAVAALAGAILLQAGAAQAAASVTRGRALVQRNCSQCHAVGVKGDSPNAAAPRFRELHERYPVEMLAEALAEGMLTGHPAMPEFRFAPRQIDDIIVYLKSIQTHLNARAGEAGAPAA